MSRLRLKLAIGVAVVGVAATTAAAIAGDRAKLRTSLSGYEEVPAVSTHRRRRLPRGDRPRTRTTIQYELTFSGIEGTDAPVAHPLRAEGRERRHHGLPVLQPRQRPGRDASPARRRARSRGRSRRPTSLEPRPAQGLAAGEFDELVRALRAGVTYANVHSSTSPGGEIRGQIENRQND